MNMNFASIRVPLIATGEHHVGDTIDEVRTKVPARRFMMPRFEQDDPVIVEVWL